MGIVVSAGLGEAAAKAAALRAGLSPTIHSRAIDSVCGSALDALALGVESLLAGTLRVLVAGGMESRSNAPYLLRTTFLKDVDIYCRGDYLKMKRYGAYRFRLAENVEAQMKAAELVDSTAHDGLFWAEDKRFMREYALEFAAARGYDAARINKCAAESHRKAQAAVTGGLFADEIVAAGETACDELVPAEHLAQELAANPNDLAGAYNSSTPADNASAVVVTTGARAKELGVRPMARILGYVRIDGPAAEFLDAPVRAAKGLFAHLGEDSFGIVEANEAFGVQLPLFEEAFPGKAINVHGGAIALGHPLGAAGVRLLTTLLYGMKRYGHKRGMVCICYGGGGGYAVAVEDGLGKEWLRRLCWRGCFAGSAGWVLRFPTASGFAAGLRMTSLAADDVLEATPLGEPQWS